MGWVRGALVRRPSSPTRASANAACGLGRPVRPGQRAPCEAACPLAQGADEGRAPITLPPFATFWKEEKKEGMVGPRYEVMFLLASFIAGSALSRQPANGGGRSPAPAWVEPVPVVAEHHYSMTGRIRPFLLFWISRDHVGGARIVWRRGGDDIVVFELLVGSDPVRAPRRLNRWGYVAEMVRGSDALLFGVMKESNEQSLEEAKTRLAREEQQGHYVFKAIHSTVQAHEAVARVKTIRVQNDLTYREATTLLELAAGDAGEARVRRSRLPPGARPGFLAAMAESLRRSVEARTQQRSAGWASSGLTFAYPYNGSLYDLTLRHSEFLRELRFSNRTYANILRAEFEIRNRATGARTRFDVSYGTEGRLAEVPVHIVYQPRWWLQLELLLDDDGRF